MICIVIPTLEPDDKFLELLDELKDNKFNDIIVVNDGSSKEYDKYFKEAKEKYGVIVLEHDKNYGKGKALKTAFEYYLENMKDYEGIVTVDSDGQHKVEDVKKIYFEMRENPENLIFGVRNINNKNVPTRSKFGNKMTLFFMRLLFGVKMKDVQTGLRGIPNVYIRRFLKLEGDRFEYELGMILEAYRNKINIEQVRIGTIYIDNNKNSHFKTFKDSFLVYKTMFKYIFKDK